jgi:hypothetical protein
MAANEPVGSVETVDVDVQPYYTTDRGEIIKIGILGALAGILSPLIGLLVDHYIISPIFCPGSSSSGFCAASDVAGYYVGTVLVAIVATTMLANWGVFRPLLIALGATLALWGLKRYMDPTAHGNWLEYYALSAALYALSYILFYWLLRVRNFVVSLVLVVGVIGLIRWAMLA